MRCKCCHGTGRVRIDGNPPYRTCTFCKGTGVNPYRPNDEERDNAAHRER